MLAVDAPGPCHVVTEESLQSFCNDGWHVVAIVQEQGYRHKGEPVVDAATRMHTAYVEESHPYTITKYVLTLSPDEARGKLQRELDRQKEALSEAQSKVWELEEAAKRVQQDHDRKLNEVRQERQDVISERNQLQERLTNLQGQDEAQSTELDALRDQMTTLWTKLGIERMRQLLGEDAECPVALPQPRSAHQRLVEGDDIPF